MVLVSMKLSDFIKLEDGEVKIKEVPYFVPATDFYTYRNSGRAKFLFGKEFGMKAAIEGLKYFKFL